MLAAQDRRVLLEPTVVQEHPVPKVSRANEDRQAASDQSDHLVFLVEQDVLELRDFQVAMEQPGDRVTVDCKDFKVKAELPVVQELLVCKVFLVHLGALGPLVL